MAFEYTIQPTGDEWVEDRTLDRALRALPSFVAFRSPDEYWLKSPNSQSSWDFDVRVFVREGCVDVEVSATTEAFLVDIRNLLQTLKSLVPCDLHDDDGEVVA